MIAVWFSCGAASAVAAKKTVEHYGGEHEVRVVNNPVAEEHPDNRRFLLDVQDWLGVEIEKAINPDWPTCSCVDVWEKRGYMAGIQGAPCTLELKRKARQHWEAENPHDRLVMGFTLEEAERAASFARTERSELIPILVDLRITKGMCFEILGQAGIKIPEVYRLGIPNANCLGCVKATSPTYWNHIRRVFPEAFAARAEQSRRIGARLVRHKGERIFLDELPEHATGAPMKDLNFECGLFCEEYSEQRSGGGRPASTREEFTMKKL